MNALRLLPLLAVGSLLTGCPVEEEDPLLAGAEDPWAYISDIEYRRAVLERDLLETDNFYAQRRLSLYGMAGSGWDLLPLRDPLSRSLTDEDRALLAAGEPLPFDDSQATRLVPDTPPDDPTEWAELGRLVIDEYPLRADATYQTLAGIPGALEETGFIQAADGAWIGLRVFKDEEGEVRVAPTCGQCHCTTEVNGIPSPVLGNKNMDLGRAELLGRGLDPDEPPPPDLPPALRNLYDLEPGQADVLGDGEFNPFGIPDLGGLLRMPYLQANANWYHRETATLAIRCETLFITSNLERSQIPRELSWAIASWIRYQQFPPPLDAVPAPEAEDGEQVFLDADCDSCHPAPDYTSDRLVTIEEVGTDDATSSSPVRFTGYVRIPSLRGVGLTGPWLHHGAIDTLEELFDADREEPGHMWGTDLSEEDKVALVAFLRSI